VRLACRDSPGCTFACPETQLVVIGENFSEMSLRKRPLERIEAIRSKNDMAVMAERTDDVEEG